MDQTKPEAGEPDHWPEDLGSEEGDKIRQRPKRAAKSEHTKMMDFVPSKMRHVHPVRKHTEKDGDVEPPLGAMLLSSSLL